MEAAEAKNSALSYDNLKESTFSTIELGDSNSTEPTSSPAFARKTLKGRKETVKRKENGKGKGKGREGEGEGKGEGEGAGGE